MEKPTRRQLNKIQCRERILKASRRLFSSEGYEDTTIEAIAEKAEVSKATVYNYFPSKDSLLVGIADAELELIRQMIDEELAEEESAVEKLRRVLCAFAIDSMCYISLSRKITYLNSCEDCDLFSSRLEMTEILRELVQEAQAKGEMIGDVAEDEIVDIAMGIYFVAQFQWSHIDRKPIDFWEEKLNRLFYQALGCVISD